MTLVSSVWREVTQKLGLLKALIGFCTIAGEESKRKAEPRTRSASRLSLAEMKRFELLRRFEADLPHFECVRNFRTWRNLTEAERSCGNPKKPEFPRVLRRQKRKRVGIPRSGSPRREGKVLTDF